MQNMAKNKKFPTGVEVIYGSNRYLTTNYTADEGYVSAVSLEFNLGCTNQLPIEDLELVEKDNVIIDTFDKDSSELFDICKGIVNDMIEKTPAGWMSAATKEIAGLALYHLQDKLKERVNSQ